MAKRDDAAAAQKTRSFSFLNSVSDAQITDLLHGLALGRWPETLAGLGNTTVTNPFWRR